MNLLLDTHVALWALVDSPRLSAQARSRILHPRASVWVSVASLWEIAIKYTLGRGEMPISSAQALHHFRQSGYRILAVEAEHATAVEQLPALHQDPFDRLLVAQALTEPMQLLTHDATVAQYSPNIVHC